MSASITYQSPKNMDVLKGLKYGGQELLNLPHNTTYDFGTREDQRFMVLHGEIQHVTGTDSYLRVRYFKKINSYTFFVAAADSTGPYSIWKLINGWCPILLNEHYNINFTGDGSALARVLMLSWNIRAEYEKTVRQGFWKWL